MCLPHTTDNITHPQSEYIFLYPFTPTPFNISCSGFCIEASTGRIKGVKRDPEQVEILCCPEIG